jgi:hypothetical protein
MSSIRVSITDVHLHLSILFLFLFFLVACPLLSLGGVWRIDGHRLSWSRTKATWLCWCLFWLFLSLWLRQLERSVELRYGV